MKTCEKYIPLFLLFSFGCQKTSETRTNSIDQVKLPVAILSKTTYILGDSIEIQLSKPLTQVAVNWDGKSVLVKHRTNNRLFLGSTDKNIGLHQLIVRGTTTSKEQTADTLTVELWSDVKPQKLQYSVLQTYPHQVSSFTQGLEFYQGNLYEGTGQNGQSKLMKIDLLTGAIIQSVTLPTQYFGEGITIVNNRIYQLTWTSGQCFQYTMNLSLEKTYTYYTQGWGITHRDTTLIVSDGSNKLSFYTLDFRKTGELVVYDDVGPVMNLNELEYIDGYLLANVWQTNRIVKIDLTSGKVVGELLIDAAQLVDIDTKENVLNGIAYQSEKKALYITGKNWPSLFRIQVKELLKSSAKRTIASR